MKSGSPLRPNPRPSRLRSKRLESRPGKIQDITKERYSTKHDHKEGSRFVFNVSYDSYLMIGTRHACHIADQESMLIILVLIVRNKLFFRIIRNKKINLMIQSDSTGNDRILQKMDFNF